MAKHPGSHTGGRQGIALSINEDRLLGAPVPGVAQRTNRQALGQDQESPPVDLDVEEQQEGEELDVGDSVVSPETRFDRNNENLIAMGVAFERSPEQEENDQVTGGDIFI